MIELLPWAMLANGPAWMSAGVALERLHEVRLDGVLEEHRHGAAGADVVGRQRVARGVVGEGDAAEALAQVLERRGETEDGHDLAGDGDVVAGLARDAVELAAEAVDDLAHGAVVEVDAAAPRDGQRIDVELVAVHEVAVDHGREQVVGRADGVDVAGEVQVEVLHREQLRVAAAGRAALDAEDRAERRLAEGEHGVDADARSCVSERPTAVTVLPSPSGVGVMAVTSMILPSGLSLRRSSRAM